MDRDYTTISPSAKSLLVMKGLTNIPFAKQAAELLIKSEKYDPDTIKKDFTFWARVVHFENRYWSINQLFNELPTKNILELSSGFSFRGLDMIKQDNIYYIDTDLPEMTEMKKNLITALQNGNINSRSKLEILPLNALDENQFANVVSHFPEGEIAIVNEGLLMYLNTGEKEKLCRIIYNVLKQRGGYWITADIYIKNQVDKLDLKLDDKTKFFFDQHNIEGNKFESFEAAESFFNKNGLIIDKIAETDRSKLSALKYLKESASFKELFKMRKGSKIQTTWRLRIKK